MVHNLIKEVLGEYGTPGIIKTSDLIKTIESGYIANVRSGFKQKKSFSPSTLVYGHGSCFTGDTVFLTDRGHRTLEECVGEEVTVWTGRPAGRKGILQSAGWKKATVESFGLQEIWELDVSKNGVYQTIRTTAGHRWLTRGVSGRQDRSKIRIETTDQLSVGSSFESAGHEPVKASLSPDGVRHGFVYGDGYVDASAPHSGSVAVLYGSKDDALTPWFVDYSGGNIETRDISDVHSKRFRGLPRRYKDAPDMRESNSYLYGFLSGYFAADGNITSAATISSADKESLIMVQDICARLRVPYGSISGHSRMGINGIESMIYSVSIGYRELGENFFIHDHHKKNYRKLVSAESRKRGRWTVRGIRRTGTLEEVFCVVQPDTEQFTLYGDILTKNCPRYWFFAFSGADYVDDVTPWQVANMESGTYGHERIQKAIADSGIMLDKETKMTNDNPPMLGYRDVLVKWDDKELPIEIKTCNDASFEARKNSRKALPYHIEQLLMYMRIGGHDLGAILYENKNTHELLAIPVEMTDAYNRWLDSLFEWMGVVYDAYLDDEIPKKQYRSNSKVCASCPLRTVCDQTDQFGLNIKPLEHLS